MFLVNSRLDLFTAAPSGSGRRTFTLLGRSLSRSYGAILPSSLTRVISITLVENTKVIEITLVKELGKIAP